MGESKGMEEQRSFSKHLHPNGHGIALRHETADVTVGDICFWDEGGKATRILNIFENKDWLQANNWPVLTLRKEEALEKPTPINLQIVHSAGTYYGFQSNSLQAGFDIYFERTQSSSVAAIIMPSSPTTLHGLKSGARHLVEQWWALAKRYAFRTWPYLLNSPTGIFIVTKAIKTPKYSICCSKGNPGEKTIIHINGSSTRYPHHHNDLNIPSQGTTWTPVSNQLNMELHDSGGRTQYTIFIERESSKMFNLTDASLKDAARNLWKLCTDPWQPAAWANQPPGWNSRPPNTATWPPMMIRPASSAVSWATFDGKDKLELRDSWYLIHGGNGEFFLEHASTALDLPPSRISVSQLLKQLKGPGAATPPPSAPAVIPPQAPPPAVIAPAPPAPINAPPPVLNAPPAAPPAAAPPAQPGAPLQMPNFNPPGQFQPLGGGSPAAQQVEDIRRMLSQMQNQQMQPPPQQRPLNFPAPGPINPPAAPMIQPITAPGVSSISPPLGGPGQPPVGFIPGIPPPVAVIPANPLPEPTLPPGRGGGGNGGPRSVKPNYAGFKFSGNSNPSAPPVFHIKPPEGLTVPIPWGWNG